MPSKYASLDEYYATLDAQKVELMQRVFATVQEEFPELSLKVAWNKPHLYREEKKYVAGMEAAKGWLMYHPFSKQIMADFVDRLSGYHTGLHTFRIPLDWEIDRDLLRDITAARLAEIDREIAEKSAP